MGKEKRKEKKRRRNLLSPLQRSPTPSGVSSPAPNENESIPQYPMEFANPWLQEERRPLPERMFMGIDDERSKRRHNIMPNICTRPAHAKQCYG